MRLGGYLALGGIEMANDVRTLAYIKNACLPMWDIQDCECEAYGLARFEPVAGAGNWNDGLWNDGVWSASSENVFMSPADDPAPWYVASDARSGEFMGLLLDNVRLLPPFGRSVTAKVGNGAVLGPLRLGQRVVSAEGLMVASTCEGMDYGERWVNEVLRGSCETGCVSDSLCIATNCTIDGIRELRNVGIIDGPVYDDATTPHECTTQRVSFQLASETAFLHHLPEICMEQIVGAGDTECCRILTPEWPSDAATRITLTAPDGSASGRVTVLAYSVGPDDDCDGLGVSPCVRYGFAAMDAGTRIVIDSRTRTFDQQIRATGQTVSALPVLEEFPGPLEFIDVAPCSEMCLCVQVGAGGSVTVKVETFVREL